MKVDEITSNSVTLSWKAPLMARNNAVAQYLIEIKADDDNDFNLFGKVDGRQLYFTCDYLRKDQNYQFRVKAKNAAGFSETAAVLDHIVSLKDALG